MTRATFTTALAVAGILLPVGSALADFNSVTPFAADDPQYSNLVFSAWLNALGCPTNTNLGTDQTQPPGTGLPYACTTGDLDDSQNAGLLLSKQGPTTSGGQAGATLNGVGGTVVPLTIDATTLDLGYDIRKDAIFGADKSPGGAHCGQSPRIEIVTENGVTHATETHFFYCSTGLIDPFTIPNLGWTRLRWSLVEGGILPGDTIKSAKVVLDDGQDGPPDNFGLAVLDNFFWLNNWVGTGAAHRAPYPDEDRGEGGDDDHDYHQYRCSQSHPDQGQMRYSDKSKKMSVVGVNGVRSITYVGSCVNFAGDAYVNGKPGYVYNFQSCQVPTAKGNFTISVTGPGGFSYQKAATMTSGYVSIHPHL
jgi:hypothetical protein